MSGENAQLKQVSEHLRLFASEITKPGGQGAAVLSKSAAMRQAKELSWRVNAIDSSAGAAMKSVIAEAGGDVRGKQAVHDAIENRVLKVSAASAMRHVASTRYPQIAKRLPQRRQTIRRLGLRRIAGRYRLVETTTHENSR